MFRTNNFARAAIAVACAVALALGVIGALGTHRAPTRVASSLTQDEATVSASGYMVAVG